MQVTLIHGKRLPSNQRPLQRVMHSFIENRHIPGKTQFSVLLFHSPSQSSEQTCELSEHLGGLEHDPIGISVPTSSQHNTSILAPYKNLKIVLWIEQYIVMCYIVSCNVLYFTFRSKTYFFHHCVYCDHRQKLLL